MKKSSLFTGLLMVLVFGLLLVGCQVDEVRETLTPVPDDVYDERLTTLLLATTTSTYDSGLLHDILPEFEAKYHVDVEVISLGTGQAIETGKRGDCDIILVHARDLEDKFVEEGHGTERWDVMYNDYILVGPGEGLQDIYDSQDITEALNNMVDIMEEEGINFLSRGDNSGTHVKEQSLWEVASIADYNDREWYNSLGQGMGETLVAANEMRGYSMADRGTYLSMKGNLPNLEIVFEEDEELFNPYGIIPVNPDKHEGINYEDAMNLVEYITSAEVQEKIGEFGVEEFGQPLFFPDAN
ncbi:MAG: tungstate ABC transporter [Candidatus Syntrophonatronum acetioxidans]|uniref:Tungstate ABC transporter n=1 Tax=Candidatus Syntrophonatronum acetioxidans TaxID=1795816 RepID=A0A424YCX2_9FIRM|nr:MAG: tungstate ABC transporter [Candidatus Syntrophonatronum acetioxidans]